MTPFQPRDGIVELHDVRKDDARLPGSSGDVVLAGELERRRAADAGEVWQAGEPEVSHEARRLVGEAIAERVELSRDPAPRLIQQGRTQNRVADDDDLTQLGAARLVADLGIGCEPALVAILDREPPNQPLVRRQRMIDAPVHAIDGEITRGVVNQVRPVERGAGRLVLPRKEALDDLGGDGIHRHLVVWVRRAGEGVDQLLLYTGQITLAKRIGRHDLRPRRLERSSHAFIGDEEK